MIEPTRNQNITCCMWQLEDFLCPHVIATMWRNNLSAASFVSSYYSEFAYSTICARSIFPLGDTSQLQMCDNIFPIGNDNRFVSFPYGVFIVFVILEFSFFYLITCVSSN